jgi:hypothetical protein
MLDSIKSKLAISAIFIVAVSAFVLAILKRPTPVARELHVKIGVPWESEESLHYSDIRSDLLMMHKSVPSIFGKANQIDDRLIESAAKWNNLIDSGSNQERISKFYSEKYKIDQNQVARILYIANQVGKETNLNPLIIIAIISHESNFQPTARNKSGAEGLMQVMTNIHKQKFKMFGGSHTTFNPEVNIRVGALILKQCIAIKNSLNGGLRYYAGASAENVDDGGFVSFILNEQTILTDMLKEESIMARKSDKNNVKGRPSH